MKIGIKETKEAFEGINVLALFLIKRLKDGVGIDDAVALFEKIKDDEEFKKVLSDAVGAIDQVPEELKDLELNEGIELGMLALQYVPKYIEAFKKG